jgi:hypothetical protein
MREPSDIELGEAERARLYAKFRHRLAWADEVGHIAATGSGRQKCGILLGREPRELRVRWRDDGDTRRFTEPLERRDLKLNRGHEIRGVIASCGVECDFGRGGLSCDPFVVKGCIAQREVADAREELRRRCGRRVRPNFEF